MSFSVTVAIFLSLCYLSLVRYFRFYRLRTMEKKHAALLKDPYAMSYKTAQEIMNLSALNDMPYMTRVSGIYALIKTYSIASGTKLLVQTRQLSTEAKVGKRVEDTDVVFTEWTVGDLDSERAMRALAKVNWMHSQYKKSISNDEMLHTLSVTALESIAFIDRFEWRPLTQLEKVAKFAYWREVGLRMGIRDIPPTLEAFQQWTEDYEERAMVFAEENTILAETAMRLVLRNRPTWTHGFFRNIAYVFLDEKVLRCLGWPNPPRWVKILVVSIYAVRAWMIRNLFLPRLWDVDPLPKKGSDGRFYKKRYDLEPWYIKDNMWTRWTVWWKSKGKFAPGPNFKSNGYLPEELGPVEFEKASKEPVIKQAEAMREYVARADNKASGCPFMFGEELTWK